MVPSHVLPESVDRSLPHHAHITCPGVAILFVMLVSWSVHSLVFRKRLTVQSANGFLSQWDYMHWTPLRGAAQDCTCDGPQEQKHRNGRITANGVPVMATAFRRVMGVIAQVGGVDAGQLNGGGTHCIFLTYAGGVLS